MKYLDGLLFLLAKPDVVVCLLFEYHSVPLSVLKRLLMDGYFPLTEINGLESSH